MMVQIQEQWQITHNNFFLIITHQVAWKVIFLVQPDYFDYESRLSKVEQKVDNIDSKVDRIETKLDSLSNGGLSTAIQEQNDKLIDTLLNKQDLREEFIKQEARQEGANKVKIWFKDNIYYILELTLIILGILAYFGFVGGG